MTPTRDQVRAFRADVQSRMGLGVTQAQDYCADLVHVTRRAWQMWERGDRKMPPGLWELAKIKLEID